MLHSTEAMRSSTAPNAERYLRIVNVEGRIATMKSKDGAASAEQNYPMITPPFHFSADMVQQIACPLCSFDYVHFGEPYKMESDMYTAWRGRGAAIKIPMTCEQGHAWDFVIGFHKGQTFICAERIREDDSVHSA